MSYLSLTNLFTRNHNPFLSSPETTTTRKNLILNDNQLIKTTTTTTNNDKTNEIIQQVWSKHNFEINNKIGINNNNNENNRNEDYNDKKMSWTTINNNNNNNNNRELLTTTRNHQDKKENEIDYHKIIDNSMRRIEEDLDDNNANNNNNNDDDDNTKIEEMEIEQAKDEQSPSHHARRPMNAFLIFCKKHRSVVRQKFPSLENRGVTRILGEWWALLDENEKSPYTNLAKEHKDAFLLANPDFKWYKLPAPPLRSLNTRPTSINKIPSPISSPTLNSLIESEFTPGKLADESQLGSLTSLMNQNFLPSTNTQLSTTATTITKLSTIEDVDDDNNKISNENNNLEENYRETAYYNKLLSPINLIKTTTLLPPKPIKKRIFSQYLDNNNKHNVARNLLLNDISSTITRIEEDDENIKNFDLIERNNTIDNDNKDDNLNNLTNQDLMNKVVDSIYTKQVINNTNNKERLSKNSKEIIRKSGRQCKGKRYEKFMVEGKLLGNKRDTKLTSQKLLSLKTDVDNEFNLKLTKSTTTVRTELMEITTPKLDLDLTIKRLAERTNIKIFNNNNNTNQNDDDNNNNDNERVIINHYNSISDNNNFSSDNKNTQINTNFNLDLKINNLPSLSYDVFSERKKESKKRKCRTKFNNNNNNNTESINNKISKFINSNNNNNKNITNNNNNNNKIVGSKKRKNKQSITHLGKNNKFEENDNNNLNNDLLLGLATLAEVASHTQKIHETFE